MELDDILKRLAEKKKEKELDSKKRRDTWIAKVIKLYGDIDQWFSEYQDEGYVKINTGKKVITEEYIGEYEIDQISLDFEGPVVVLDPIGTNIIGAFGRIDIYLSGHYNERHMIVLSGDDIDSSIWKIIYQKGSKSNPEFNREVFVKLLEKWLSDIV